MHFNALVWFTPSCAVAYCVIGMLVSWIALMWAPSPTETPSPATHSSLVRDVDSDTSEDNDEYETPAVHARSVTSKSDTLRHRVNSNRKEGEPLQSNSHSSIASHSNKLRLAKRVSHKQFSQMTTQMQNAVDCAEQDFIMKATALKFSRY
jgi:hypothetical protein